ncbi:MAG: hypothetical protein LBP22_16440 [Deltaproteobacteria bacterium]|nr:hypothetical protein [Deltaproteobacteria bacterium]
MAAGFYPVRWPEVLNRESPKTGERVFNSGSGAAGGCSGAPGPFGLSLIGGRRSRPGSLIFRRLPDRQVRSGQKAANCGGISMTDCRRRLFGALRAGGFGDRKADRRETAAGFRNTLRALVP